MTTLRLYYAVEACRAAVEAYIDASFNGNYSPARTLPYNHPVRRARDDALREECLALAEAKKIMTADTPALQRTLVRRAGERDVLRKFIQVVVSRGFVIALDDGGDKIASYGTQEELIEHAMNVECFTLICANLGSTKKMAAFFVAGNSPEEFLADYNLNLDLHIKEFHQYVKTFYDPDYIIPDNSNDFKAQEVAA